MNTKWELRHINSGDELCEFMATLSDPQQLHAKVMYIDAGHTAFMVCYPEENLDENKV